MVVGQVLIRAMNGTPVLVPTPATALIEVDISEHVSKNRASTTARRIID